MASSLIRPPAKVIENSRRARELTLLQYPLDLGPHAIIMNFHDYTFNATRSNSHQVLNDSVTLPVPMNLQDNLNLKIGSGNMGALGGITADILSGGGAADTAKNTIDSALTKGQSYGDKYNAALKANDNNQMRAVASLVGTAANEGYQIMKYFGKPVVDAISPGVGLALDTYNGTAVNPHVAIEFDGVGLKRHTFEWTFSPKSEAEAEELRKVVKLFKQKALPRYKAINNGQGSLGRGLLEYPSLVNIFFVGIDPAYFWYFKPCMISSFNVNYSPQGVSIAKGGKPTAMTIQIELQEATIHTAEDYDG